MATRPGDPVRRIRDYRNQAREFDAAVSRYTERYGLDKLKVYAYGSNLLASALGAVATAGARKAVEKTGWVTGWLLKPIAERNWWKILGNPTETAILGVTDVADYFMNMAGDRATEREVAEYEAGLAAIERSRQTSLDAVNARRSAAEINDVALRRDTNNIHEVHDGRTNELQELVGDAVPAWYRLYQLVPLGVRGAVLFNLGAKQLENFYAFASSVGEGGEIDDLYTTLPASVIAAATTGLLGTVAARDTWRSFRNIDFQRLWKKGREKIAEYRGRGREGFDAPEDI